MAGAAGVSAIVTKPVRTPVPDRVAVWDPALSVMIRVPVSGPIVVGVNVTEIVQAAPVARVFGDSGQFDVSEKLPVVEIDEIVSAAD